MGINFQLLLAQIGFTTLIPMGIAFVVAFIVIRRSQKIARRLLQMRSFSSGKGRTSPENHSRSVNLLSGLIRLLTWTVLVLVLLGLFVDSASLLWFIGLFSAGFGIGARPIIADYLTGISLIFEDSLEVGEKVEFPGVMGGNVEGVVEDINLRTTLIRARSGEPLIVPNGEIRVIRNFSRANFSEVRVKFQVKSKDAHRAIDVLEELSAEAVTILENLMEPWTVLSEDGQMGATTVLRIVARAKFGTGAIIRPRMMVLVQERLAAAGIELEG